MPRFWIPLDNRLPDITLDFQELFDHNYDDAAYGRRIDYRREPIPPLDEADAAWADALLRSANLRPLIQAYPRLV